MTERIRWGIIGTGRIAAQFADGLAVLPDAALVAVGSRAQESADAFGDRFDVSRRHASYEALAEDPEVDVVYIATPHPFHQENSILCLRAGKAVLCEKPFAINAGQAQAVIDLAREEGLFLMEAMWTRFLPTMRKLRELLAAETIGPVQMMSADFGFRSEFDPTSRLFDPALGGGALLDVGVYTLSLAEMTLGPPARITSMAHIGETGVDEQAVVVLGFGSGQMALLSASVRTTTSQEATLLGTEGQIKVHAPWWQSQKLSLTLSGQETEVLELPFAGNGYQYEAQAVMDCLRERRQQSAVMPWDETLSVMRTMDRVRAQWGLRYPME
jgi:predicted dehydrogenase